MLNCWVLTSDKKGTIHQAIGIPIRLGINYQQKTIKLPRIAKILSYINLNFLSLFNITKELNKNIPDLIISSGHDGLILNAYLKKQSSKIITIHVQKPGRFLKYFDLAAIPKHDNFKFNKKYKDKIIITNLGLHHITNKTIQEEGEKFSKNFKINKLTLFFSIGGKSAGYDLNNKWIKKFCTTILSLEKNYQIFISTARRTDQKYKEQIKNSIANSNIILLDKYDYNYYLGALAKCDFTFVTCESVSMISEACFIGKKIFLLKIPGFRKKISKFNKNLIKNGYADYFDFKQIKFDKNIAISTVDDNIIVSNAVKNILLKNGHQL